MSRRDRRDHGPFGPNGGRGIMTYYFWLGQDAEFYEQFEDLEDYEAHLENEEMKALGY